ncbi:MAG: archaetidylinositol phosphate synthase [Candidatus Asgardarchaeia archaeon]
MLNRWKKFFERKLNPIGRALAKLPISSNILSVLGLISSFIAAYFILNSSFLLSVLFILVSGFFDMVDGLVARIRGQVTKFGEVLDSVLDRYSDAIIFAALIYSNLIDTIWGLLALIGSLLTSYARAKGEIMHLKMSGVGLIERPERILLICIGILLIEYFPVDFLGISAVNWVIIIIAIATNISVIQRMFYIRKELIKLSSD